MKTPQYLNLFVISSSTCVPILVLLSQSERFFIFWKLCCPTIMEFNIIIRCSPYHPASNGEAERFVRTFKEAMKTGKGDGLTLTHRLDNFLLTYRTTPHTTTGTPPCELLMGRRLRTRWDLLKPDIERQVQWRQSKQKFRHDLHSRARWFTIGDSVMARNFRSGSAWIPGKIVQQLGPLT